MKTNHLLRGFFKYCFFLLFIFSNINAQQNNKLINEYLVGEQEKNKWLPSDISDWLITDQYTEKSNGITYVYIQQRHLKVIVYNAISNFLIKDGKVLYFASEFCFLESLVCS